MSAGCEASSRSVTADTSVAVSNPAIVSCYYQANALREAASPDKALGFRNLASFQVVAHPEGDHYQALRDFVAVAEDS